MLRAVRGPRRCSARLVEIFRCLSRRVAIGLNSFSPSAALLEAGGLQAHLLVPAPMLQADANSESTISIDLGSDTLQTKAVFLGRISAQEGSGFDQRILFWDRFLPSNSPTVKYPTGVQPLQAAFRTIVVDNDRKEMKRLGSDQDLFVRLVVGFFP